MSNFLQILFAGLQDGMTDALVALALVLVFKAANVLNFAQGTLAALSGFIAYWFFAHLKFPWFAAAGAAIGATALIALAIERLTIRPVIRQGLFTIVIVTLALDQITSNTTQRIFGASPLPFPIPLKGNAFTVDGVHVQKWSLFIIVLGIATLVLVDRIVNHTSLGLAMRAFAYDQPAAQLMGVEASTVSRATWVISLVLGGIIGIVLAPVLFLQVGYMQAPFINGFTGAVLGGFTSLFGGAAGGLILGIVNDLAIRYAPQGITASLPMLVVLAILLIRPRGLFVRKTGAERV